MDHLQDGFFDDIERHRPYHEDITQDLNFSLKMMHYENDDQRRRAGGAPQVHGRELLQLIIHLAAQTARSEIFFDTSPVDRFNDGESSDIMRRFLEQLIYDPQKDYEGIRDLAVLSALSARMGGIETSFEPHVGFYGEVVFHDRDGRTIMWAQGYHSPHHLLCPYTQIYEHVNIDEARSMEGWEGARHLVPDDAFDLTTAMQETGSRYAGLSVPRTHMQGRSETVVIARRWDRQFRRIKKREKGYYVLEAGERFMQCASCLARSESQDALREKLPEKKPRGCEECGGDLIRQVGVLEEDEVLQAPKQRLTVFAPYQRKILQRTVQPLRSAPITVIRPREFPNEPMGGSVTSEHWSLQAASDESTNIALQHLKLAIPRFLGPKTGLEDADENPWDWDPARGVGMYYTGEYPPQGVQVIEPQGMPSGWPPVHDRLVNNFLQHRGTNDPSLPQDKSRDIPVGTMEAFERLGELPVEHFIRKTRRAESVPFGCAVDFMRNHYTNARVLRQMAEDGREAIEALRASDLPNMDVIITSNPSLAALRKDQMEALIFLFSQEPWKQEAIVNGLNLDRSMVRRARQAQVQEQQRQAKMAAQAQGAQNTPPAPSGNGAPAASLIGGAA